MINIQNKESNSKFILELKNVKKYFPLKSGFLQRTYDHVKAVDDISFDIREGEIFGLVGESGCGKSTLSKVILRLIEPTDGEIFFRGTRLNDLSPENMRMTRKDIQMIFQDPLASLNPRMTIHKIITRPMKIFKDATEEELNQEVLALLEKVGLNKYATNLYPHQFSGGQLQRVGIARALGLKPKFLILDEPTSALDVSIQYQIIELLLELREELNLTYLFISHDLSLVKLISQRTAVMYKGQVVELADTKALFKNPVHPYTQTLIDAIPRITFQKKQKPVDIKPNTLSRSEVKTGCRFFERCQRSTQACTTTPELKKIGPGHYVQCHLV